VDSPLPLYSLPLPLFLASHFIYLLSIIFIIYLQRPASEIRMSDSWPSATYARN
jgi:hypothetical protein